MLYNRTPREKIKNSTNVSSGFFLKTYSKATKNKLNQISILNDHKTSFTFGKKYSFVKILNDEIAYNKSIKASCSKCERK